MSLEAVSLPGETSINEDIVESGDRVRARGSGPQLRIIYTRKEKCRKANDEEGGPIDQRDPPGV